ncbi:secA regulator SecM [Enterobacterales bacterium CwR94]|nr:secA regulator SecM [Enterobacterales bacterium CwR94]
MIAILNRWRQFGRRYFWPHLLLGMVAASFGLPAAQASEHASHPESHNRSLNVVRVVPLDSLVLLQGSARRGWQVDHWHQHTIRTVIRHLSFSALTPAEGDHVADVIPNEAHKLVLLDTLSVLLTRGSQQHLSQPVQHKPAFAPVLRWQPGLWRAQVQGNRADPDSLHA